MIKVKSIGYQLDNVQVEVGYDLDGETYSFTLYAKLLLVSKMTSDEIKDYIRVKITSKRITQIKDTVETLLNALIDVDLEATQ